MSTTTTTVTATATTTAKREDVSTPPQEIALQHAAACKLIVTNDAEQASRFTEIPLSEKQAPVTVSEQACWSTRGQFDISALQELVKEGYNDNYTNTQQEKKTTKKATVRLYKSTDIKSVTNLWDPINAAVNNVAIRRPSHDAWGIGKVVLIFCDDFLENVYELPWWQHLRHAVMPILDQLEKTTANNKTTCTSIESRIVRLLLASLPPGVTIPRHHDSGAWVSQTHRIHVPVLVDDPNKIYFTCGVGNENGEFSRISCNEGHVFEINNQAMHAVSNCHENKHRVHLILDYVDNVRPDRIKLDPGEILLQTRRSIDRYACRGSRPTPTFMILGVQKCGTTSLYEYMNQHPLVIRPKRRETHSLDWRWNECDGDVEKQKLHCLQFYQHKEMQLYPSCLTGDSTPSYLLDSPRVIPRIKRVFDHYNSETNGLKFFVMLREPVKRAESHYAMVTSTEGTPAQLQTRGVEWRNKSIDEVVKQEMEQLQACGLVPYWDIESGTVNNEVFESFVGSSAELDAWKEYLTNNVPLNTGSHNMISRGLYALNLQPWFEAFAADRFLVLSLDRLNDDAQGVMNDVWSHLNIPKIDTVDSTPQNARNYDPIMSTELKEYLQRFYQPHNARLSRLLGSHWTGTWSY